ncbi:type I restriction enzyme S subunit [Azospirillum baldaniorum]|uniref:restriction endonuclease subunit S n=1 Tax=Azospirillum baldaniorum TaxID=1064539 RepID=UPI0011A2159C|nr:restriction endonuclease subunit S [Azospirillum baldaniorum]TWA69758.1 type I restriction enzyme S subunit [Azospirillum baldaniorum]
MSGGGELPVGWTTTPISDLAADRPNSLVIGPFGSNLVVKDYRASGVPLVFVRDIRSEEFGGPETKFVSLEKASELAAHTVSSGDLLITKMGDPPGDTSVYPDSRPPAVITADCIKLTPDPRLTSSVFLKWMLRSRDAREQILDRSTGVAQQKMSLERFRTLELDLPPLPEQRRIVEKIEALTARSHRAREALDALPALIDRYRQSILAAAFRGNLTAEWRTSAALTPVAEMLAAIAAPPQPRGGREATDTVIPGVGGMSVNDPESFLPDGWTWVPLLRVARQETGHTPSRSVPDYWDGDIPWIGIRDAGEHHGRIILDTQQHVTQAGLDNSAARLLPKGTVCLSRTASVGYITIMGRDMATSQDFATWTCTDALDPKYLMYALLSEGDEIRRFGKGSTHTTIYFPEIRAFHIALAPIEEQREVVRRIEAALRPLQTIQNTVEQAKKRLSTLDQSILAIAFKGELVPQDPNDEPASVLLERIRIERAATGEKPRRRRRAATSTTGAES